MLPGFSWINEPSLAAMPRPYSIEELTWLRSQGIDVLLTLTESALPKQWVDEAGLMAVHLPVPDFEAPTQEQLRQAVATIQQSHLGKMGVAVHCAAGRGRTGTVVAAYLVSQGATASEAMSEVRKLRPGSIETREQEEAIFLWAKSQQP
jgi:atypical dual specificity phosphatase